MEVKSHHRTRMAFIYVVLVKTSFCPSTVVSIGLIYVAFLSTYPEGGGFVVREIERCDRNFTGFVMSRMNKLERFLKRKFEKTPRKNRGGIKYLWLRKHVNQPATYCPICTTRDKVMRILRSNHMHSIYRMCVPGGR